MSVRIHFRKVTVADRGVKSISPADRIKSPSTLTKQSAASPGVLSASASAGEFLTARAAYARRRRLAHTHKRRAQRRRAQAWATRTQGAQP